jgi:hypothetical protein
MNTSDGFEVPFALKAPTIARMTSAMEDLIQTRRANLRLVEVTR